MAEPLEERIALLEARVARLEKPAAPPRVARDTTALEDQLGKFWLSRLGIVSLITGVALLIITYFGELGPIVRVAVGYAIGAAVAWVGLRIARTHETFGRIVFGGGLAIGYFVTYALHFVAALRVVDSEVIGVILVAVAIAAIVATAHRMRSETVAGIALFLGLHTGMLSEVTALSLIATTLLAAGAAFFLAKNRWVIVPLSTVVAVYSTHATLAFGHDPISPELRAAFVGIDFTLFASALLIARTGRPLALLGVLNWLGALGLGGYAAYEISRDVLFLGLCGFAVVLAIIAALAKLRREAELVTALQAGCAIVTLALAFPVELVHWQLCAGWLVLALVATALGRRFTVLALVLVLAAYVEHDQLATQIACVLVMFAVERSSKSPFAVAGVALGLLLIPLPAGFLTLGWVAAAFLSFAIGFALEVRAYRWAGFAILVASAARMLAVELRHFTPNQRILTFVVGGIAMLAVSFVYARRRS